MSATETTTLASLARAWAVEELAEDGIEASLDAGAFYPQPIGVLVGLPAMVGRGVGSVSFELSILVVSGDPLNSAVVFDRLYRLADQCARSLHTNSYRPSSYRGGVNAEPLPALELSILVTLKEA